MGEKLPALSASLRKYAFWKIWLDTTSLLVHAFVNRGDLVGRISSLADRLKRALKERGLQGVNVSLMLHDITIVTILMYSKFNAHMARVFEVMEMMESQALLSATESSPES